MPPPQATATFTVLPTPGANAGEIATTVQWANCNGIAKVKIHLYRLNAAGTNLEVFTSQEHPSTLASGSWATTFTALTSGTVIKAATVDVLGAGNIVIATKTVTGLNVTVP